MVPSSRLADQSLDHFAKSERCCDEEVIARLGCTPSDYARADRSLERKQFFKAVPVFPGIRPVDVTSNRLERIMKLGQGCRKRSPWWCWAIVIVGCAITLPGAAAVLTAQTSDLGSANGKPRDQRDQSRQSPEFFRHCAFSLQDEAGTNAQRVDAQLTTRVFTISLACYRMHSRFQTSRSSPIVKWA